MGAPAYTELARRVRTRITDLGYRTPTGQAELKSLYGFRDRLKYGPYEVTVPSLNRFEITLKSELFNEAVQYDLYHGMLRIRRLVLSAKCLLVHKQPTAWILTTCYYAAFFAAVELTRCSGQFVDYLGEDLINNVTGKAPAPMGGTLEPGTYESMVQYDSVSGMVKVSFAKKDIRHHHFTWQQVKQLVSQVGKHMTGIDAVIHNRLVQFLGQKKDPSWPSPSDIRNHWNYEDATLFGQNGERSGEEFRKLASDSSRSLKWSMAKSIYPTRENKAAAIAMVMAELIAAAEDVSAALLPDNLMKKLPE